MDFNELLRGPAPGDITIGEAKRALANGDDLSAVKARVKPGREIRVRFMIGDNEAPDAMTLEEWRAYPNKRIVIDDEGGGHRVPQPERTL